MKIYTSYYNNVKNLPKNLFTIGISIGSNRWVRVNAEYKKLAPTKAMISKDVSIEEYKPQFEKILSKLNPEDVVNELFEISGGIDVVLLCYEKPGDFCHRHMVADWLNKKGYEVKEYQKQSSILKEFKSL